MGRLHRSNTGDLLLLDSRRPPPQVGTAAPHTCLHTHSDSAPYPARGSQGLKHTFTFSCFNLKKSDQLLRVFVPRPHVGPGRPGRCPGTGAPFGLCEGPARSGTRGPGLPGRGATGGLGCFMRRVIRDQTADFACENSATVHPKQQRGACTEGPRAPLGMGFYTWAVLLPFH